MEEAIGSKIADYLIKPKSESDSTESKKNLDHSRLISQKTTLDYKRVPENCDGNGNGEFLSRLGRAVRSSFSGNLIWRISTIIR
jgi:hypothetical protein